ncbi:MAG TPA: glycosyltransferase family 39 protein [Blastocatellia bacterium]|nr:glycosyltransferase family 39 protein [Blastocatellia bacterium]
MFAAIAFAYAGARFWQLSDYGLYGDETFTLFVARSDWHSLIQQVIADVVHPPLFYILLKTWILIGGDSVLWLKLFPFATSVAAIAPYFLLCRELRMKPAAINLALALMATNAFLFYHAQELRMYDLLLFLSLVSLWLFVKSFNDEANSVITQLLLFAVNLLLVYTHYYGWGVVAVELLLILLIKPEKRLWFSMAMLLLVACFLPWAYLVSQAALRKGGLEPNLGWNTPPNANKFLWYYATVSGAMEGRLQALSHFYVLLVQVCAVAAFLFWIPIIQWARRIIKNRRLNEFNLLCFLLAVAFLPAIAAFAISFVMSQSVWSNRYLIGCAPAFMIMEAIAITSIKRNGLRKIIIGYLVAFAAISGSVQMYYTDRVAIEPLVNRLVQTHRARQGMTKIFTSHGNIANSLRFYLEEAKEKRFDVQYVDSYEQVDEDFFYIAFMKYLPEEQTKIENEIVPRGFTLGEPLKSKGPTYEVVLIPVTRALKSV